MAAAEVETPESAGAARLQTLAGEPIAQTEFEMHQLWTIGEQLTNYVIVYVPAISEFECVQLAAAFGDVEQTRNLKLLIT